MSRRRLVRLAGLGAGGAALSLAGAGLRAGILAQANDEPTAAGETHPAHWSYEGESGPEHWGDLDPEYARCSRGAGQSPVDVAQPTGEDLADPAFAYEAISPLRIVNNGHTVQVNVPAGQTLALDGSSYELRQFHFHAPSEHTIDGEAQAMELHLVHVAADGTIAVVGLLLRAGAGHAALTPVFEAMPAMAGPEQEVEGSVDLAALLPARRTTYRYLGSLTTPPCSEGVHWLLFAETAEVAPAQVAAFRRVFGANARPVQALNGREVEEDTTP